MTVLVIALFFATIGQVTTVVKTRSFRLLRPVKLLQFYTINILVLLNRYAETRKFLSGFAGIETKKVRHAVRAGLWLITLLCRELIA